MDMQIGSLTGVNFPLIYFVEGTLVYHSLGGSNLVTKYIFSGLSSVITKKHHTWTKIPGENVVKVVAPSI